MLRRLPSAASLANLLRPSPSAPTTSDDPSSSPNSSRSRSHSFASSALDDALSTAIVDIPPVPQIDPLTIANHDLVHSLEALQGVRREDLEQRLGLLAKIQHVMTDQPDTRNTFREHGGFLNAVSVLASLEISAELPSINATLRFEICKLVFAVLALAFDGHHVNRAAFADTVGYEAIGEAIKLSGLMLDHPTTGTEQEDGESDKFEEAPEEATSAEASEAPAPGSAAEKLLSILYSFLTNDFSSTPLFTFLRHQLHALDQAAAKDHPASADASTSSSPPPSRAKQISLLLLQRADSIQDLGPEAAEFAEIVPLMLRLQAQLCAGSEEGTEKQEDLSTMVLCALKQLAMSTRRSQITLREAGIVGIGLERLFPRRVRSTEGVEEVQTLPAVEGEDREIWVALVERLLELGVSTGETRALFKSAVKRWEDGGTESINEEVLEMILGGVRRSRLPSFVHFDLSLAGHSSLTMRSLGRPFPPSTHGYAYLGWLSIDIPPSPGDERLVIFGCGDATGKCHFEICLTPELNLSLSTSLAKPPIIFSEFTFSLGKFHHLAVVHQRPRYVGGSSVNLYVDGKLVEIGKAPYPVAPPKDWEVQAWLGTPRDRVPEGRLNKGLSKMKWDLGPTWLIHGDVPEEMVYVCWSLGPRYNGNFQDQLGQFQTNASSTVLNVRLDSISRALPKTARSAPTNSALVFAIRDKGSAVIPEHRIYFAFSGLNVLVAGSGRGLSGSGVSEHAQQALNLATASKGKAILNSAIPGKIEEALTKLHGLGQLSEACVANPKSLDVAIWKIGGIAVALRLVELASSEEQLETTVQLFVEVIGQSWRNSEDAERIQAYEILAHHLKAKASLITGTTHDTLLAFCGFDFTTPSHSVVSNVLAFRFLVLDFALWGAAESSIQWAHFDRLRELVQRSEHAEFNLRRLSKMHIVRKLLFSIRAGYFDAAMLDEVVDLLMLIVKAHFTTESVRHLATFLTATLCQVLDVSVPVGLVPSSEGKGAPAEDVVDPSAFVLDARKIDPGRYKSSLRVLQALHDLLISRTSELQKFAKIITTKWMLLFLLDRHAPPLAAVLGLRILVRLLQTQGSAYAAKFTNSTDGFVVLRGAVPHVWNYAQIHLALFALLHDHDISTIGLDANFASTTFLSSAVDSAVVAPDVVRVIIACLGRAVKVLESSSEKADAAEETAPSEETGQPQEPSSPSTLSRNKGFSIILDLLSQANRAMGTGNSLVASPVALADLVAALRPALRLPAGPEYPPTSKQPPLPILSARNGYRSSPRDLTLAETPADSDDPLKLQIPAGSTPSSELPASPLVAFDEPEEALAGAIEKETIGPAAMSLLKFLSQQVTHHITTRHVRKRSLTGIESLSPNTEPSLQVFREILDASASTDVHNQVVFRTLLVKDITRRLSRASTAPLVSGRISTFLEFATDLAFQGWTADVGSLLEFSLSYLEKLLDDTALGSPSQHSKPLTALYKTTNRLILLAISDDETVSVEVLSLLVRHQLTVFAPQNDDDEFVRCLIQRLDVLARAADDPASTIDFFKLFILQRPSEIEAALGQQPRQAVEAPFIAELIDTDNECFLSVLTKHSDQLAELALAWDLFVAGEFERARLAVEKELSRVSEHASTLKHRRDAARRRVRRQRASIYEWSEGIHEVEATRVAHTRQDLHDHHEFIQTEWLDRLQSLQRERGIWGSSVSDDQWALDFTEGYHRMRKKMQAEASQKPRQAQAPMSPPEERRTRSLGPSRNDSISAAAHTLDVEQSASPVSSPVTPQEESIWSEGPNGDAVVVEEEPDEDKNRKVRRSLEAGDVIESVFNISRIVGLDACGGLLLLAKKNVYIIDGFFQTSTGELVDAADAPPEERDQHLQTLADLAGRTAKSPVINVDAGTHRSRRWSWGDLVQVHERKYLFRNVALELFFADGRSFLLTFDKARRATALSIIASRSPSAVAFGSLNLTASSFSAKLVETVSGQQRTKLEALTARWQQRLVSNFEYIMFLNTISGRTYNDLTNYPVFPWIIADYESETLDLGDPKVYRDLSKPMGAQSEDRKKEFQERYSQLSELDDGTHPFHYGTHYSSAMIVVGYLVRLKPFTESFLSLQGGSFDHADRMFWSIPKAWESSSKQSRSDVRELIPEFFYLPDFLRNPNGLDLGKRQENEARIDDVVLPPWAKGDPRLFVELNRKALESEYVSANLHQWIDLVFGCKSGTGPAAVEAVNVFHHLSYESSGVDLDTIEDADERRAATSTIHNFGMTPKQLFLKPHPAQIPPLSAIATRPIFSPDLLIEQQAVALVESIVPVLEIGSQVSTIYPFTPDKLLATPTQSLFVPGDHAHTVSWGYGDQSVRIHAKGNSVPLSLFESLHAEFVSAACFADARTLVTGSTDTNVSLWRWRWRSGSSGKSQGYLQQLECLRGHSDQVVCVAASRSYSIIVSGSEDKTAIIWDLNRQRFVHLLAGHESKVQLVAISDTTGDIVTCSGAILRLWTINGQLLATHPTSNFVDPITAVAFSKSETEPIIATGHRGGRIMLWRRERSDDGQGWKLNNIHSLQHFDRLSSSSPTRPSSLSSPSSSSSSPEITCLAFTARTLYSGDAQGRVWLWNPPGTELFLSDGQAPQCMGCWSKFGLIESRKRCTGCAGVFCSMCTVTSVEVGGRFCRSCFRSLSVHMVL